MLLVCVTIDNTHGANDARTAASHNCTRSNKSNEEALYKTLKMLIGFS